MAEEPIVFVFCFLLQSLVGSQLLQNVLNKISAEYITFNMVEMVFVAITISQRKLKQIRI